jgi:hypothetical protein
MRVWENGFGRLAMKSVVRFPVLLAATALLAAPCLAQDPPPDDIIYQPINEDGLRTVASGGFGDRANSWAASMQWFKGDLYVGTSRASQCVTLASLASRLPVDLYPFLGPGCPADAADLSLAAEIWRYSPASARWDRVYRSPIDIPVRFDASQRPTKFTARDIAFRSMTVVKEPGGHEALYVGGMSAGEVFPAVFAATPYPARILRTRDGVNWNAVPQTPGTLLGDLGKGLPGSQVKPVIFDALVGYRGRLFAAAGDSLGNNAILAASDPAAGDNAWQLASPQPETFPVSALAVYNDMLYCAVTGRQGQPYSIFKADAAGPAPLTFSPVMTGGGSDAGSAAAWRAVSLVEFKGRLYVGTGTPPELVRIDADDSWDLLIGTPRTTDAGLKRPLSGVSLGLGSAFSAQFRALTVHEGKLYLGTSDWSQVLEALPPFGDAAQFEFGFDLFRSDDGISWVSITRTGLGADHQPIVQRMQSTPAGLFVGSASSTAGAQVWQKDATASAAAAPAPPERLEAVSEELGDEAVILSWEPSAGATQYRVYRSTVTPLFDIIGGQIDPGPLLEMLQGACDAVPLVCGLLNALQSDVGVPSPFMLVGTTSDRFLVDERASTLPALYFVRAEDGAGRLSGISNMAGGPSRAAFITFPGVEARLDAANQKEPSRSRMRILKLFRRARMAAGTGSTSSSERLLDAAEKGLKQGPVAQRVSAAEVQDLTYFLRGLRRNVWLGEQDLIPIDAVLEGIP